MNAVAEIKDIKLYMRGLGEQARAAARVLARADSATKDHALAAAAAAIRRDAAKLLAANAEDVAEARAAGLEPALLDRLQLTAAGVEDMAEGLEQIARLPDPIGAITDVHERPSGIRVGRMRVPLGVIGIIYESRPNVTADAAGLCLKSGNAAILRGGSEALRANRAIAACMHEGLDAAGLHAGGDGAIGMDGLGAAAQDRRVAGLQAQPCRVRGHVGARFVDDADDAERHAHLADLDAGRAVFHVADLADGVGQGGDLLQAFGHALHRLFGEGEPVHRGGIQCMGFRGGDILGILGDQPGAVAQHGICDGKQRAVLGGGVGLRHQARCGARLLSDGLHVLLDVFHDGSNVACGEHFSIPLALECALYS